MGDKKPEKTDDTESTDSLVEAANNLEDLSQEELQELLQESRIVIRPGGQVVIENLTADLLDVAYELDPDNPGIQCRVPGEEEGAVEDEEPQDLDAPDSRAESGSDKAT